MNGIAILKHVHNKLSYLVLIKAFFKVFQRAFGLFDYIYNLILDYMADIRQNTVGKNDFN
jgi:lipid-A-disaccharide synthase-like uncharacterized protein